MKTENGNGNGRGKWKMVKGSLAHKVQSSSVKVTNSPWAALFLAAFKEGRWSRSMI